MRYDYLPCDNLRLQLLILNTLYAAALQAHL